MAIAASCAGITKEAVMGQLVRLAHYDSQDFLNPKTGEFDYKRMRRKGLTFLIEGIEQTTRTSQDGAKRVTVKYKLPRKLPAIEALMRALGMEKEPAKNPIDAAKMALEHLKKEYPDLAPGKAEQIIAQTYGVPITELGVIGDLPLIG